MDVPNCPHQSHSPPMTCDQFFYSVEIRQICRRYLRQNGAIKDVTEGDRFKVMLLKKMDELQCPEAVHPVDDKFFENRRIQISF